MKILKFFIGQVMGHPILKFIRVQMRFTKPMCLLGIKTYCPFEVLFPKNIFFHKKELSIDIFAIFYLSYLQLPQYVRCFWLIIFEETYIFLNV
jgi:hypothetical protein